MRYLMQQIARSVINVKYVPPTCFDLHKVVIKESYTEAFK